nr:DUF397 domain-containing protein [Micromonospora sp. DSM 115978]
MGGFDRYRAVWRKSTRSNGGGACVEVAVGERGVGVRDSKDPAGPVLVFGAAAWTAFVAGRHASPRRAPAPGTRPSRSAAV